MHLQLRCAGKAMSLVPPLRLLQMKRCYLGDKLSSPPRSERHHTAILDRLFRETPRPALTRLAPCIPTRMPTGSVQERKNRSTRTTLPPSALSSTSRCSETRLKAQARGPFGDNGDSVTHGGPRNYIPKRQLNFPIRRYRDSTR